MEFGDGFDSAKRAADANTKKAAGELQDIATAKTAAANLTKTGDDTNRENAAAWPGNRQGN